MCAAKLPNEAKYPLKMLHFIKRRTEKNAYTATSTAKIESFEGSEKETCLYQST
jgi:hypothetical protein